jgi:hypothetical protein
MVGALIRSWFVWGCLVSVLGLGGCEGADGDPDSAEPSGLTESAFELGAPYAIGAGAGAGSTWTRFTASSTTLYATAITPPREAKLSSLRVVAAAAGGTCRLALYSEASGRPSRLLASTSSLALAAGVNAATPSTLPTLSAGTRYWMAAQCSGSARLYRQPMSGQTLYAAFVIPFLPLPGTFPSSATATAGTALGLFAVVEDVAAPVCTPNVRRCNGASSFEVCNADGSAWLASVQCPASNNTCINGVCTACTPNATQCLSPTTVGICSAIGTWVAQACPNQACINGACAGVCSPQTTRCSSTSNSAEVCAANGTWTTAAVCGTGSLCSNGVCVANPPFDLGPGASFDASWAATRLVDNELSLLPLTPTDAIVVQALRLRASVGGGVCRMALYSDNAGLPESLISATTNFTLVNGVNGAAPSTATTLRANTRYWLGALCSGGAQLYGRSSASNLYALPVAGELPARLTGGATRPARELSFFLTAQRQALP